MEIGSEFAFTPRSEALKVFYDRFFHEFEHKASSLIKLYSTVALLAYEEFFSHLITSSRMGFLKNLPLLAAPIIILITYFPKNAKML